MKNFSIYFIALGLVSLILGALFGVLISIVYISPDFLKDWVPFNQMRPLHTTLVVSWIILTAVGGVYFYLSRVEGFKMYSPKLMKYHFFLYLLIGVMILVSLFAKKLGGREYMVFSPYLILPILVGWVFFGVNYFKTLVGKVKNWPVYFWMWGIGIVFMIFHLSEANFWVFDYFRTDYVKDTTVQWKSYGSFVGSWNMLVYGTAIYLMAKIKKKDDLARSKTSFFFFFLGLTNLMFGWAHHTYILPTLPWVRYAAYIVSMTEWIIFIKMIYGWSKSLTATEKKENSLAYLFLMASDFWVFVNLVMALLMSIPALNFYSHGTHITVAHSMGTTIGINTCILFASVSFILSRLFNAQGVSMKEKITFYTFNASLLLFWITLIAMGVKKMIWQQGATTNYGELHEDSQLLYVTLVIAGTFLFLAILYLASLMLTRIKVYLRHEKA